jgi:hypothetical protein
MYGLVVVAVLHLGGGGLGSERLGRVVGRVQANKEVVDEQRALVPQFLLSPPSLAPASPDARGPREGAGMGARSWGTAAGSDTSTDGSRQKHLSDHGDGQIHRVLKEAAVQWCLQCPSSSPFFPAAACNFSPPRGLLLCASSSCIGRMRPSASMPLCFSFFISPFPPCFFISIYVCI